jgi:hypothetical protein
VTAKWWKEAVRADLAADLRCRWWFSPAYVPTPTSTRAFETACGPLGPEGRSLMESTPFSRRIQRRPMPLKSVTGHGRILVFSGLASIFAGLEFAVILFPMRFAVKTSGYASC